MSERARERLRFSRAISASGISAESVPRDAGAAVLRRRAAAARRGRLVRLAAVRAAVAAAAVGGASAGKCGEATLIRPAQRLPFQRLLLFGLGAADRFDETARARRVAA